MRAIAIGVLLAAALGANAFAQTDFEAQHGMRLKRSSGGFAAAGTPLGSLSKASRAWITAEIKRQTETPKPVEELSVYVDFELHEDEIRVARQHRLNTVDIVRAVTLEITQEAEDSIAKALQAARKAGDEVAIKTASERLTVATANRKAAMNLQTEASRALAGL